MPRISVKTQTNNETGMQHILHVSVNDTLYQSYCGYRTHKETEGPPQHQTLELTSDDVCSTCVNIFAKEELDLEEDTDIATLDDTAVQELVADARSADQSPTPLSD